MIEIPLAPQGANYANGNSFHRVKHTMDSTWVKSTKGFKIGRKRGL